MQGLSAMARALAMNGGRRAVLVKQPYNRCLNIILHLGGSPASLTLSLSQLNLRVRLVYSQLTD